MAVEYKTIVNKIEELEDSVSKVLVIQENKIENIIKRINRLEIRISEFMKVFNDI